MAKDPDDLPASAALRKSQAMEAWWIHEDDQLDDELLESCVISSEPMADALGDFAREGDLHGLLALLKSNPSLDGFDRDGFTPLGNALRSSRVDCVRALLDAGADPDGADFFGQRPLHRAAAGFSPLAPQLIDLLAGAGADIEGLDEHGATPFLAACRVGVLANAQALLSLGAHWRAIDAHGADAWSLTRTSITGLSSTARARLLAWLDAQAEREELEAIGAASPRARSRSL